MKRASQYFPNEANQKNVKAISCRYYIIIFLSISIYNNILYYTTQSMSHNQKVCVYMYVLHKYPAYKIGIHVYFVMRTLTIHGSFVGLYGWNQYNTSKLYMLYSTTI